MNKKWRGGRRPSSTPPWRTWRFWQKLVIYFWFASIGGHVFEVLGSRFYQTFMGESWHPAMPTILPLAAPYGLGAVALILLIMPLMQRFKLHLITVFMLATLVVSIVELLCALVIVLFAGHNQYWDYSAQPLNVNGFISIKSSLVFGVLATIFIYLLYPLGEKVFRRLSDLTMTILFWMLAGSYGADLLFLCIKWLA